MNFTILAIQIRFGSCQLLNEFLNFCRMAPEMPPPPPPPTSRSSATASREAAVVASATDHQLQSKAYLSPSDASIDESVKSAQAGKDVSDVFILLSQFFET